MKLARTAAAALITSWSALFLAACQAEGEEALPEEAAVPGMRVGTHGGPHERPRQIQALSETRTIETFLAEEARQPKSKHRYVPRARSGDDAARLAFDGEDWFTVAECREWADDLGTGQWFYKNHYSACLVDLFEYQFRENCPTAPCPIVGRQRFRLTILGFGYHQQRSLDWAIHVDDWKPPSGRTNPNAMLRLEVMCNAFGFGDCDQTASEAKTLAQWRLDGLYEQFGSPDFITPAPSDLHPEDKKTWLEYMPLYTTQIVEPSVRTPARCDTATYVGGLNGGCIFTRTEGVLEMDENDPAYGESARFISTAFWNIRALHRGVGLYVPGNYDADDHEREPLTRNFYGTRSRTKVQAECRALYAPDYTTNPAVCARPPCDCDEYPFSATYQNANYDTIGDATTFVVKPVNADQNQAAGRHLETFLTDDHILDGDPFWVFLYGDDD